MRMYITSDKIICDPAHKTGDCGGNVYKSISAYYCFAHRSVKLFKYIIE